MPFFAFHRIAFTFKQTDHKQMRIHLLLIILFLGSLQLTAQSRRDGISAHTLMRIKQEGFDSSEVMQTLFQLTDVSGPRLTGSKGLLQAQQWAKKQLSGWGLKNAKLERWGTFGRGWENHKCYIAMTAPYYQPMIAAPKAWTPGTNGLISSDLVLITLNKPEDMNQYHGKVRGKIAVFTPASTIMQPGFKPDARRLSEEDIEKLQLDPHIEDQPDNSNAQTREQMRALSTLRQKADSFLLAEGAAAVITGSRAGNMGTVFTTNGAPYSWTAKPVLPAVEMGTEDVNRLTRLLQAGKEVRVEMELQNSYLTTDSTSYNVIAEIPGTDEDLADEVVMLGAHIDSWHAATGATDNAAGVAVMMEAVRILKALQLQPRRTIRIALWSGEEQGLHGSRNYVKNHFGDPATMKLKPEQRKVSAYYNLDNGAGKIRGIYLQGNDAVRPIFEAWLAPFKDLDATTLTIRNTGSTDHIPFDAIGIPGFQFIQDPLEYGTRTHHTNMDTYDRVNKADLMQASIIIATLVYNTAMRDQMLPRKPLPKAKA
jgi:carboxypeptidase Q